MEEMRVITHFRRNELIKCNLLIQHLKFYKYCFMSVFSLLYKHIYFLMLISSGVMMRLKKREKASLITVNIRDGKDFTILSMSVNKTLHLFM